ncbi:MAG TPA: helix-turn-helix transcriptional regulator [Chthoniobacteraceae bacterium]
MKRDTHLNVIGPEIRRIRKQRGWSQSKLALRLQSVGWQISRSALAKIECRIVWVGDFELLYFVSAFGVAIGELFPRHARKAPVESMIAKLAGATAGRALAPAGREGN